MGSCLRRKWLAQSGFRQLAPEAFFASGKVYQPDFHLCPGGIGFILGRKHAPAGTGNCSGSALVQLAGI